VTQFPDLDKATALVLESQIGIAAHLRAATEPVIGRAFARPVGDPPPAITASLTRDKV